MKEKNKQVNKVLETLAHCITDQTEWGSNETVAKETKRLKPHR